MNENLKQVQQEASDVLKMYSKEEPCTLDERALLKLIEKMRGAIKDSVK